MDDYIKKYNEIAILESIIDQGGNCIGCTCTDCPLSRCVRREDGTWHSCASAVQYLTESGKWSERFIKAATVVLGRILMENMLRGSDDR